MSSPSVVSRADPQEILLLDENTLDPDMTYRWVLNAPANLTRRQAQGYRLVSREEDGVATCVPDEKSPDDYIRNGDSILMCCPKALVAERRSRTLQMSEKRLGAPVAQFKREHQHSGIRNSKVLTNEEGE
jgi:hypothetical protein